MLKIFLTRHGETEWNIQKRMQGWSDSNLTENGVQNALALGKRLKEVTYEAIYTSPSGRTVATSKLIKGERDIPLIMDKRLKEIHLGDWEGQTSTDIEKLNPIEFHLFWNSPNLYRPISGESFTELQQRVLEVLNFIRDQHPSGNILIVTHAVVLKTILAFFKRYPLEKLWDPPFIHGTSLSIIEWDGKEANIILEADMSHVMKDE